MNLLNKKIDYFKLFKKIIQIVEIASQKKIKTRKLKRFYFILRTLKLSISDEYFYFRLKIKTVGKNKFI